MPLPLIATSAYPMSQRWMDAYFSGIAALSEPVTLLLMCEAGVEPKMGDIPPHTLRRMQAKQGVSGVALRAEMLKAAATEQAEFVICVDFDDVVMPDAVDLHRTALKNADISYGDMVLIDDDGLDMGSYFLAAAPVPDAIMDSLILSRRNFLGLTNTAVAPSVLENWDGELPENLLAADWWFFTRCLDDGAVAVRTEAPVVSYRSHASSLLGARKAGNLAVLSRRLKIAQAHFRALTERPDRRAAQDALELLAVTLSEQPVRVEDALAALPPFCQWFQEVFALADIIKADLSGRLN